MFQNQSKTESTCNSVVYENQAHFGTFPASEVSKYEICD